MGTGVGASGSPSSSAGPAPVGCPDGAPCTPPILDLSSLASEGPATSSSHPKFGEGSLLVGLGRGHGGRMPEPTPLPLREVHIRSPKYHHPEGPQRAV